MRVLWPRYDRKVYYFTFGANLDESVLTQRRIKVFAAFDHVLENASLQFTQPGFYDQHGYASADPGDDSVVYGKVYLILERDARRMDYFEGEPFLRVHEKVFRQTDEIRFYYYRTTRIVDGLKPTREYLDYLLKAYAKMDIVPQAYIERIQATEVLEVFQPVTKTSVFVRDLSSWPNVLQPFLLGYERQLQKFVEFTWNRSLVQWAIRNHNT
jgi:gamma-glutamylcyclotransferase (GGCT)/AIG2-like uncharacterized protein YtfP